MTTYRSRPRRDAFTLVELLVVMAIIAILMGLALAGINAARDAMVRAETFTDIGKMADSLEVARTDYRNIKFLPSKLILYNDITVYKTLSGVPAADVPYVKRTGEVLTYMFGRRLLMSGTQVSWDGTTTLTNRVVLSGPECLVFYLGGMPNATSNGNQCLGFSTNPTNPTQAGGQRMGPYYQFKSSRLSTGPSGIFFVYSDPYGIPFAYFGLTGGRNSYDPTDTYAGMTPYVQPNGTYLKPDRYQIISAGKDKLFGPGGTWDPSTGSQATGTRDNLTNFSRSILGGPQS